jgi:hypothetical protein
VDVGQGSGDFDRFVEVPGVPHGLAWTGRSFVTCNGVEPRGFIRLAGAQDGYEAQLVPVIEPRYRQAVGLTTLTWNGKNVVGYTDGAWFQSKSGSVFTIHDPTTLEIERHVPAPSGLGAIAWDGQGYWAATRANTRDSGEPSILYRLDASFAVVSRRTPPSVGCQGLAWAHDRLWSVDVFSDTLHEIDVSAGAATVVSTHALPFSYASGIGHDGRCLWVAEHQSNRLHRIGARTLRRWMGLPELPEAAEPAEEASEAEPQDISDEEYARLREQLWADESFARMRAASRLRELGYIVDRARETPFGTAETGPEDTELLDLRVEVVDGDLLASWRIHVGEALFSDAAPALDAPFSIPTFARYTITAKGEAVGREVPREYDAEPGVNARDQEVLASGLGSGKCDVSVFIHVQYVTPEGGARILNNNAGWVELEN